VPSQSEPCFLIFRIPQSKSKIYTWLVLSHRFHTELKNVPNIYLEANFIILTLSLSCLHKLSNLTSVPAWKSRPFGFEQKSSSSSSSSSSFCQACGLLVTYHISTDIPKLVFPPSLACYNPFSYSAVVFQLVWQFCINLMIGWICNPSKLSFRFMCQHRSCQSFKNIKPSMVFTHKCLDSPDLLLQALVKILVLLMHVIRTVQNQIKKIC
jgi:hypothetical protein